jgi:carboxyl-terminal processing protease
MRKLIIIIVFLSANIIAAKDSVSTEFLGGKYKYILEMMSQNHADTLDVEHLSELVYKYLLQLADSQSAYYTSDEFKKINEQNEGSHFGIGVNTIPFKDTCHIVTITRNSPAYDAGLKPGDKILSIDGNNLTGSNSKKIIDYLHTENEREIKLTVMRLFTNETEEISLKTETVVSTSVNSYFRIPGSEIGYISLNRFSNETYNEFKNYLELLISEGVKQIVLDLRGNPGGYLLKAVEIADEFISGKKLISYTESRIEDYRTKLFTEKKGLAEDMPLVIIIDGSSASGSEVLAGAVQDYDRGLVIGKRSFGKGSVQKMWNLSDGSAFRLTVAEYFTPLGRRIRKEKSQVAADPASMLNIPDSVKNKLEQSLDYIGDTRLPVYETEGGRTLIGGGGIFPDYFVDNDTLSQLTGLLKQRGVFILWAIEYLAVNHKTLLNEYPESEKFIKSFKITTPMLRSFASLSISNNIWNEEMFINDKNYIINYLKAALGFVLWDSNVFSAIMINHDRPVLKAIELMPEAAGMIK